MQNTHLSSGTLHQDIRQQGIIGLANDTWTEWHSPPRNNHNKKIFFLFNNTEKKTVDPELCLTTLFISPFEWDTSGMSHLEEEASPSRPGNNLEVPLEELQDKPTELKRMLSSHITGLVELYGGSSKAAGGELIYIRIMIFRSVHKLGNNFFDSLLSQRIEI